MEKRKYLYLCQGYSNLKPGSAVNRIDKIKLKEYKGARSDKKIIKTIFYQVRM